MISVGANTIKNRSGFSIIELLVYISLLGIVTAAVVPYVVSLGDLFATHRSQQEVFQSAVSAAERIERTIDRSAIIDAVQTSVPTDKLGHLALVDINGTTTEFVLTGSQVEIVVDGSSEGFLTSDTVDVNEFRVFTYDVGKTQMIRVQMEFESVFRSVTTTKRFNIAGVMRNTYE